ncbi:MAG TPA: phosphosulfolactate synthase [Candidatus Dormibacteraeota bacterium]|nr:phosphosulfolactate synthase [Candidatus Dormibacteraeota bacterium]
MRTDAGFLGLPARPLKPRSTGLTHVLDRGVPLANFEPLVAAIAPFVDIWKFGWGTSYLDRDLADKLAILARHQVLACPGGTLAEVAWLRHRARDFLDWAEAVGFSAVEVSNGASAMPAPEKRRLIALASGRFVVLSEVGSKDPRRPRSPVDLVQEARADLEAGARWVVIEGREQGDVGLYREDGSVREEVVEGMAAALGPGPVVFEAPRKQQQVWLIRRFGRDVNLGNVAPAEVLGLETLRLGLRADTLFLLSGAEGPAAPRPSP